MPMANQIARAAGGRGEMFAHLPINTRGASALQRLAAASRGAPDRQPNPAGDQPPEHGFDTLKKRLPMPSDWPWSSVTNQKMVWSPLLSNVVSSPKPPTACDVS